MFSASREGLGRNCGTGGPAARVTIGNQDTFLDAAQWGRTARDRPLGTEHWSSNWGAAKVFSVSAVMLTMPGESAAVPALPAGVRWGRDWATTARSTLSFGMPELEGALPDGGLPQGQVVELLGVGTCLSTSVCLGAIREAQQRAGLQGGEAWGAFIDPGRTLYAPAVARAGVQLDRLLVLHPNPKDLSRVAIQLAEARAFAVIVVDLQNAEREYSTREWSRAVRRIALAIENTKATVLLLTSARTQRGLSALPVGLRVQLSRITSERVSLTIAKDKQGRVGEARSLHAGPYPGGRPAGVSSFEAGLSRVLPLQDELARLRSQREGQQLHAPSQPEHGDKESRGGSAWWKHPRDIRPRLKANHSSAGAQMSLLGGSA